MISFEELKDSKYIIDKSVVLYLFDSFCLIFEILISQVAYAQLTEFKFILKKLNKNRIIKLLQKCEIR